MTFVAGRPVQGRGAEEYAELQDWPVTGAGKA